MAVDMFLKIDGIKGESTDDKHKDEIRVLAWKWGLSNAGTAHLGAGAGAGKVNVQDLSVTKMLDKSSPDLILAACNGKHFKEANLYVRKAGEKPLEYLKITLTGVLITSVSTGGSGGEDTFTENVSLNFGAFKYHYAAQKADGSGEPVQTVGWDIAKNVKV